MRRIRATHVLLLVLLLLVVPHADVWGIPARLPDIPACGTSDRPDLVMGYLICAVNTLHADNVALQERIDDMETISKDSAYADRLWSYMGDRGEFDEQRRLSFQDPRRQLQTKYQVELALCRWGVVTVPRLVCPPVNPLVK